MFGCMRQSTNITVIPTARTSPPKKMLSHVRNNGRDSSKGYLAQREHFNPRRPHVLPMLAGAHKPHRERAVESDRVQARCCVGAAAGWVYHFLRLRRDLSGMYVCSIFLELALSRRLFPLLYISSFCTLLFPVASYTSFPTQFKTSVAPSRL